MAFVMSRLPDGGVALAGLEEGGLFLLRELPEILHYRTDPRVHARMYPDAFPGDEAEHRQDWHATMDPELELLFASAEDLVVKDLAAMGADGILRVPAKHLAGWLSGLNQARIILGTLYGVEEDDMRQGEGHAKQPATVRIHFFGFLMQVLMEGGELDEGEEVELEEGEGEAGE